MVLDENSLILQADGRTVLFQVTSDFPVTDTGTFDGFILYLGDVGVPLKEVTLFEVTAFRLVIADFATPIYSGQEVFLAYDATVGGIMNTDGAVMPSVLTPVPVQNSSEVSAPPPAVEYQAPKWLPAVMTPEVDGIEQTVLWTDGEPMYVQFSKRVQVPAAVSNLAAGEKLLYSTGGPVTPSSPVFTGLTVKKNGRIRLGVLKNGKIVRQYRLVLTQKAK